MGKAGRKATSWPPLEPRVGVHLRKNPYSPGAGQRPAALVGRDVELQGWSQQRLGSLRRRDETQARRRAASLGRDLDELRCHGLAGSPDEIVDKIGPSDVDVSRIYLQVLDLHDLEFIASEIMHQLS